MLFDSKKITLQFKQEDHENRGHGHIAMVLQGLDKMVKHKRTMSSRLSLVMFMALSLFHLDLFILHFIVANDVVI